ANKFRFIFWDNTGVRRNCESTTIAENTGWHHVVGVFNGTNALIYIDGILENSVSAPNPIQGWDGRFLIGQNNEANIWFKGTIDEVHIYNRALTAAEVLAISNSSKRFFED
ncbi:MAG: LamG domain-containing protein, partial [Candidatus Contubernalis sp.]|nr:LamG domain-containing protein [Candidatus Contubernalis sp.]